jgi:hypothetical protein
MENNQTIYYGENKTTITNINHLRDIEISILNYISQLSHIVNHKFLYKKASLNPINRHFLI